MSAAGFLAAAAALLAGPIPAPIDETGHLDPAAFEFVVPGVTRAEVVWHRRSPMAAPRASGA